VARLRRPKAARFPSYVEYRTKTNVPIIRKIGHAKGRSHTGEGGYKRKVKENVFDILWIQE
jgi:hypothetical protein